jgi:hypothetical protein
MADTKISALPASTTPLAGTEVLPIVQSGATKQVSVANLTAGRAISGSSVTASTGNFVVGTSGQGIDFSATPSAGTSELLADYEEGNYTGTLTPSTSGTITVNSLADRLNYTKIGRVVYISGFLEVGSVSAPVGSDVLLNLPFAISNLAKDSSRFGTAIFADSAVRALTGYNSGTSVYITMTAALVAAGDQFYISFNYIAA